jgi:hypothetical protein
MVEVPDTTVASTGENGSLWNAEAKLVATLIDVLPWPKLADSIIGVWLKPFRVAWIVPLS